MKNLEQIKNEYAVSKGYEDFDDLLINVINYEILSEQINEVMKIYAMECLKLASDNLSLEECGFDGRDYGITNENNIIK